MDDALGAHRRVRADRVLLHHVAAEARGEVAARGRNRDAGARHSRPIRPAGVSALLPNLIALVLLLGITAYSTAGGEARHLVDHAMAPVWEVNNVWLVLSIVVCWTGFPLLFQSAFASLYL